MSKEKTLYIHVADGRHENPLFLAIGKVATTFAGAKIVDVLVDDQEVEADVAVVDSIDAALRVLKETEKTFVLIGDFAGLNPNELEAFAARFPNRVRTHSNRGEEPRFVVHLLTVLTEGQTPLEET